MSKFDKIVSNMSCKSCLFVLTNIDKNKLHHVVFKISCLIMFINVDKNKSNQSESCLKGILGYNIL